MPEHSVSSVRSTRTSNFSPGYIGRLLGVGTVAVLLASIVGCGGGGGGDSGSAGTTGTTVGTSSAASAPITFTSVAMAGELLTYTVDTSRLTYNYTITNSQYGLTGKLGWGTLVRNTDGTYSPAGIPNAKIFILQNGIMLAAIRETIDGAVTTIPIIGMASPAADLISAWGTYNYVQRTCANGTCGSGYGTFHISPSGVWSSCTSGDITTACTTGTENRGTLNSLGGGKWQVLQGGSEIGTAIAFNSGDQKVLAIDVTDKRIGGVGVGILVGSTRQPLDTASTDGTWLAATSTGLWGTFNAAGNQIAYLTRNGAPFSGSATFRVNAPWSGMMDGTVSGVAVMAVTGVYVAEDANGYAEIGVKIK